MTGNTQVREGGGGDSKAGEQNNVRSGTSLMGILWKGRSSVLKHGSLNVLWALGPSRLKAGGSS